MLEKTPSTPNSHILVRGNSKLLMGAGIATILALSGAAYGLYRWQNNAQIAARANWENIQVQTLRGHAARIWFVALSPEGRR